VRKNGQRRKWAKLDTVRGILEEKSPPPPRQNQGGTRESFYISHKIEQKTFVFDMGTKKRRILR